MARKTKLELRINQLINRFQPQIRDAFLAAIQSVKDQTILKDMVAAIEAGNAVKAFELLGLTAAALRSITATIERAFETGGVTVASDVPRFSGRGVFLFDVRNSRAEASAREISSKLVTRITEDTRANVRTIIETGIRDGVNPRTTALDIVGRYNPVAEKRVGGIVGLTQQQRQFVSNARNELPDFPIDPAYFNRERRDRRFDSIVRKAIEAKQPLDSETISRLTTRYTDSLLQLRGETIARTESIAALNASQQEAFLQAVESGVTPAEAVQKEWDSAGDNRVRRDHQELNGQRVALHDPFTIHGARLMYPGDTSLGAPANETINCRCRVRYVVDWFAGVT